jgi:hypothetical protein
MLRSLLRSLYLSSLLLIGLASCAPTHGYRLAGREEVTTKLVRPIINADSSSLYKAKINLYTKYYSGLILLKQTDASTSHLVFVTELGMKMFDFQIQDNQLKLIYVFEPLNKPKIVGLLENDMKLIFLQHLLNKEADVYIKVNNEDRIYKIEDGKRKIYYTTSAVTKTVEKIITKNKLRTKENVKYMYDIHQHANQIKLKHKGLVHLQIELTAISK